MRTTALLLAACACALAGTQASPVHQEKRDGQAPFHGESHIVDELKGGEGIKNDIDIFKHLSAISPFFLPETPAPLPPLCTLRSTSLLIRHSSILGNDDEWEDVMRPFVRKVRKLQRQGRLRGVGKGKKGRGDAEWAFIRKWRTGLKEDTLEEMSEQGGRDAQAFGTYVRDHYGSLMPQRNASAKGDDEPAFKVWTASSPRDISTAKRFILGAFPRNQTGHEGEGDGDVVQLVEVPNKRKEWRGSLTPHKACDAFEKTSSLLPAAVWLRRYAPAVRERLGGVVPKLAKHLVDEDVLAMAMLCGYETIQSGDSGFCGVFTDEEWLDFEYYMDIRFHHMMGYGQPLAPFLGMPWVKSAMHLLGGHHEGDWDERGGEHEVVERGMGGEEVKLPKPKAPPNATHTQYLHAFFTHRESPAFVATALNLYNQTTRGTDDASIPPASISPPLEYRPAQRAWKTSELVPFLGNIALERFTCPTSGDDAADEDADTTDYIRVMVNGKQERMAGCEDGPDGSCEWQAFKRFVREREQLYGRWREVCEKPE